MREQLQASLFLCLILTDRCQNNSVVISLVSKKKKKKNKPEHFENLYRAVSSTCNVLVWVESVRDFNGVWRMRNEQKKRADIEI